MGNIGVFTKMTKNPHAVALGRIGGQKGGKSKKRSKAHYKRAAKIRWDKFYKGQNT